MTFSDKKTAMYRQGRIAAFGCVLVACALITPGWSVTDWAMPDRGVAAQTLKRTDPGHLQGTRRGTYNKPRAYPAPPHNKPHQDPFAAGVIWRAQGPFANRSRPVGELSEACRQGRFGRIAGGYADFEDLRVTAAPPRGIYNRTGEPLLSPIYFFRYENSTNCQVYVPQ